jgi:redox-sensitive bicupin YhaK (pirin superfamily)
MSLRPVQQIIQPKPTIEGAGVKLQRAFGFGKTKEFDPFLLLDDFRNDNPEDYVAGFPWHPHRGIETITYVLAGSVEHGDSLGNKGKMTAGDATRRSARPHARFSAVGESARVAEDDRPALSGYSSERDSRGH